MKVVVDSSVLIDQLRGNERARATLSDVRRSGDELWSATIVRAEILTGMRRGEELITQAILALPRWQDLTVEIADHVGELRSKYRRSHQGIDIADFVIAATTQALGARLLTLNVKHFPMIAGLKPAY